MIRVIRVVRRIMMVIRVITFTGVVRAFRIIILMACHEISRR